MISIDKPYDIVVVTYGMQAGGTERVISMLAGAWAKQGSCICVITFAETGEDFFPLPDCVGRYSLKMPYQANGRIEGLAATLKRIFKLRKMLKQAEATVVISFLPVPNIVSILATWGLGLWLVISERNDPQRQLLPYPWEILRKRLYRYADIITVNSKGAGTYLQTYVPEEKIRYIPNPAPVASSHNRADLAGPTILTVGRLTDQKAHDVLISAFARIASAYPQWRLAIIGEGHLKRQLVKQAEGLGICDQIDWLGEISDPFPYYRAAEIFVLPSRFEGTPNVLLEAMSCGIPSIVTDASPGPLEYVELDKSGLVVPVDNSQELATAMKRMIDDKDLRHRFGRAGQQCLSNNQIEVVLRQWENVSDAK